MVNVFRKSDILSSVILGEIVAIFLTLISKNLGRDIPALDIFIKSKWLIFLLIPALSTLGVYVAFHLGKNRLVFFQFGKFITIGLSNTAIDFGVLNLLIFLTNKEKGYLYSLFKGISFMVGAINSYLWNKFWTFENLETGESRKQFFQFFIISGAGLGINVFVASFVVNVVEPINGVSPKIWANVGAFAAIVVSVFWDFFGYKFVVFKK